MRLLISFVYSPVPPSPPFSDCFLLLMMTMLMLWLFWCCCCWGLLLLLFLFSASKTYTRGMTFKGASLLKTCLVQQVEGIKRGRGCLLWPARSPILFHVMGLALRRKNGTEKNLLLFLLLLLLLLYEYGDLSSRCFFHYFETLAPKHFVTFCERLMCSINVRCVVPVDSV